MNNNYLIVTKQSPTGRTFQKSGAWGPSPRDIVDIVFCSSVPSSEELMRARRHIKVGESQGLSVRVAVFRDFPARPPWLGVVGEVSPVRAVR